MAAKFAQYIARDEYECPKCKEPKLSWCKAPSGKETSTIHMARMRLLTGSQWDECTVPTVSAEDMVNELKKTLAGYPYAD
jgi:hypothetical protein